MEGNEGVRKYELLGDCLRKEWKRIGGLVRARKKCICIRQQPAGPKKALLGRERASGVPSANLEHPLLIAASISHSANIECVASLSTDGKTLNECSKDPARQVDGND